MKKIFSFLLLACLSLATVAQAVPTKPQAIKSLMAKEHLSNTLQSKLQPAHQQSKFVANQPATWNATAYDAAKSPAELTGLDTTEVYFTSFYDDPIFTPADTMIGRNNQTIITPAEWYFVLRNERYQFIFDIVNNANPETLAGTYTEKDLEEWFSWCMFPEANGDTHYYKTCELTITEEKLSATTVNYIVDAVVLATCGIGGKEYGYFKVHAEHQVTKAAAKYDVAILNCVVTEEEDRIRITGQDDTIAVDLTFFTELGVEGYYSHKIMDTENSHIVHRGVTHEIAELDGIIAATETKNGGMAYLFMFEAMTTDAVFYNVAMEAPIVPVDTVEISCYNMVINDDFGMSHSTIEITASNSAYEVYAGYMDTKVTAPKEYTDGTAYVYLTDLRTGQEIESSLQCNLSITGNQLQGYKVEISMLGSDYKQYNIHLVYEEPEVQETVVLDFPNSAKAMYYIDNLGLKELQLANFDGEYSVSFDILYIDQVMGGEFDMSNMFEDQTFIVHHVNDNGDVYDVPVQFAEFGGKVWQENGKTFLTASILGFDSVQYEISMFYEVPTPTETVTYTFDGLGNDVVDFTNAVPSSGIFILDAMSADGMMMAKVNVERITTKSVEGTFYNDGLFDHTDFYPTDTWVKVWNADTKEYEEYSVQKGSMTVEVNDNVLTAVASFICDNAVQYDLTFKAEYEREHIAFDSEEGEVDYTYAPESQYEFTTDYVESDNQLYFDILAPDYSNVTALVFFVDHMDDDITIPEGVYPINSSMELGTVYASPGVAVGGGPIQSYFCYTYVEGDYIYFDEEGLYCLVDGTVTVEKVDGKLKVEVDAVNSYDLPVKLHYNAAETAVENVMTDNTNVSKRIVNGQLLIIRNGETYNANGALVK
jgi:hypothetical protein